MIKLDIRNPQGLHLSESNFRKHEADIASFLRTFPAPIALSHPVLACSTYTAQLRNAINAHITKRFKSEVDPDVLREAWSKSVAIRSATSVTLGPKHAIRALTNSLTVETAASITAPNYLLELDSPTIDVLRALARAEADSADLEDFKALISPAAAPHLERMARLSHERTLRRFGRTAEQTVALG
jgi:hypothetical protein